MAQQPPAPLAGTLRVFYFAAIAALAVTMVLGSVTSIYQEPAREFEQDFRFEDGEGQADYNRNLGLIFGFIGTPMIAASLLAFGSRYNPLRIGLLAAGVALAITGVGFGANGSDAGLTLLTSGLAFLVLLGSGRWLEEGYP